MTENRLRAGRRGEQRRAFDDLDAIADAVAGAPAGSGAWLHIDGAFGLWTAASPALRHLVKGAGRADSRAFDTHKWLNVPYDSGVAFCAHPQSHRAAMTATAEYLVQDGPGQPRDAVDWTPAFSRRARGFAVYAALRSLGRRGVAELFERTCAHARAFAAGVVTLPGCEVVNDVVVDPALGSTLLAEGRQAVARRDRQTLHNVNVRLRGLLPVPPPPPDPFSTVRAG